MKSARKRTFLAPCLAVLILGIPAFAQMESALSYPGTVPDTAAAAALARDVIGRINKAYRTLLDTDAQGFEAVYALAVDGQAWGEVAVSWSRESGSTDAKFRPAPGRPADSAQTVSEIEFFVADNVGENAGSLALREGLRGLRRGDWWIVDDLAPAPDTRLVRWRLVTCADLSQAALSMAYADGVRRDIEYKGRRLGNGFVLGTKNDRYPVSGIVFKTDFGYSLQAGRLFVQSLRAARTRPGAAKDSLLAVDLRSVTFR
jgi:hypothetical protein